MEAKEPFFGLRAYRAPQGLPDVVERSTNLLGYLELPGWLEKNIKISTSMKKWRSARILAVGSPKTAMSGLEEKSRFPWLGVLVRKCQDKLVG